MTTESDFSAAAAGGRKGAFGRLGRRLRCDQRLTILPLIVFGFAGLLTLWTRGALDWNSQSISVRPTPHPPAVAADGDGGAAQRLTSIYVAASQQAADSVVQAIEEAARIRNSIGLPPLLTAAMINTNEQPSPDSKG